MKKDLDAKPVDAGMQVAQGGDDIGMAKIDQIAIGLRQGGHGTEGHLVAADFRPFGVPLLKFLQGQGLILLAGLSEVQENFNIHT